MKPQFATWSSQLTFERPLFNFQFAHSPPPRDLMVGCPVAPSGHLSGEIFQSWRQSNFNDFIGINLWMMSFCGNLKLRNHGIFCSGLIGLVSCLALRRFLRTVYCVSWYMKCHVLPIVKIKMNQYMVCVWILFNVTYYQKSQKESIHNSRESELSQH